MKPICRREFVRESFMAASAAVIAGPFIRSARAGEPGPNDKIRVGLIGCGGQGCSDLKFFLANPEIGGFFTQP